MPYGIEVPSEKEGPINKAAMDNPERENDSSLTTLQDDDQNAKSDNGLNKGKKRFYKLWLWIIPFIILIVLLVFLIHGCKSPM